MITLERITQPEHPLYARAMELYKLSFPDHEQREPASQARILHDEDYHFTLVRDEGRFLGIALYWEMPEARYLEHFCILPEARNGGCGRQVLSLLQQTGRPLILEIDPPVEEISRRRKGFYERCGFVENPFPHVHPPYHPENSGHPLQVLSSPRCLTREEYEMFAAYLRSRVMAGAFA